MLENITHFKDAGCSYILIDHTSYAFPLDFRVVNMSFIISEM